jgi:hypothetical protein
VYQISLATHFLVYVNSLYFTKYHREATPRFQVWLAEAMYQTRDCQGRRTITLTHGLC